MQPTPPSAEMSHKDHFWQAISNRFSLHQDRADDLALDASLRTGVELSGATPWVLMFAILIASIGLNVNSTAVIIGAMLISPLMGPIMGIGYGVAIYDFAFIRKSLFNLGIATAISLLTSTLYFLASPLTQVQSELLARTSPTIWDVLIAVFGGLAGAVGATRKERSNVVPGVAIATALMPPLCTAGYGMASANWTFFYGAFYLFAINCVFIAATTAVVISLLKLPHRKFVDAHVERRVKVLLFVVVLGTTVPSLYLAANLVREEVFKSKAHQFVQREFRFDKTHLTEAKYFADKQRIEVTLIGEPVGNTALQLMRAHLEPSGLQGVDVVVHQAQGQMVDVTALKTGIVEELFRESQRALQEREQQVSSLKSELENRSHRQAAASDIARELKAQFPAMQDIVIGEGTVPSIAGEADAKLVAMMSARSTEPVSRSDRKRIEDWFQVRAKASTVRIYIDEPAGRRVKVALRNG